ncbi:rnhA operon protein [Haloplanus sp. GCM10025708]|uniref:DUF7108 family protein n=1 Tax=Haloferacaceae TaxID=1644056 RepID=UPI0036215145
MAELPQDVVDEAERLTRLARDAVDESEAAAYERERASMLAEHDFTARIREEDDTLVLHPEEWVEDGVIRVERIEDVDRGIEVSLAGAGDPDDWDAVEEHNAAVVDAVAAEAGEIHAENARAFADFMGNHYAKRIERATADELQEFLDEYYPRNAWPSDEQRAVIAQSLELAFDAAKTEMPEFTAVRR